MPALRARTSAALVAALVAVAGCTGTSPQPASQPNTPASQQPTPSAEPAASAPTPVWEPCSYGECAAVDVPLDHAAPDGPAITLALTRVPASRQPAVGTLFVNPGGPGGSGRTFAAGFPTAGLEGYDIVGWDPRGIGASTPAQCPSGAAADAYLGLDGSPDSPEEVDALAAGNAAFARACRDLTGDLIDHLSVRDTAADLDLLREALGEERLTYYGASYGTAIGAAYVALYPDRVGRLVLDAGVEPRRPPGVPQAFAFESGLAAFSAWCAASGCPLGPDASARVAALLGDLDATPLAVGDRTLTQSLATSGIVMILGSGEGGWSTLADALAAAEAGDGAPLLQAADAQTGRRPDGTHTSMLAGFTATYCADDDVRSATLAQERWADEQAVAPILGHAMGSPFLCVGWTAAPAEPLPLPATPGGEVVVIGAPGDPVTPFPWSQELAAALPGSVLVEAPGHGHVAFRRGSACVDAVVVGLLADAAVPGEGTSCA